MAMAASGDSEPTSSDSFPCATAGQKLGSYRHAEALQIPPAFTWQSTEQQATSGWASAAAPNWIAAPRPQASTGTNSTELPGQMVHATFLNRTASPTHIKNRTTGLVTSSMAHEQAPS